MSYFPFFADITDKTFLIVGGGRVAAEKVSRLIQFTDRIVVVAPETDIPGVKIIRKSYETEDLKLGDYVIAATGDRETDRRIASECRERKIPVNAVDDIEYCDFIFPSMIRRGDLTVAVSTSGKSPAYARRLRKEIEALLPDETEAILERMGELRAVVSKAAPDQKTRGKIYTRILSALIETENRMIDEEIAEMIRNIAGDLH